MRFRSLSVIVLIPVCLLAAAGCKKKPPQTAADLPLSVETTAMADPAPVSVPEPEDDEPVAEPADPLESGDLALINEYVTRQGLLGDVYFDFDRASLSEEARERLARNARFLREHGRFSLVLEGHCDERGTSEYNLALGERRAHTAKDYLVSLGAEPGRLSTISYGEERPVCGESEEECWKWNRRAHPVVSSRTGG